MDGYKIENNNFGDGVINIVNNIPTSSETLKKATIDIIALGFRYLINQENSTQLYFFKQQDEFSNRNKDYIYYSDYIGMVVISNNNINKEIVLKKFKFVAENIIVDTTPYLDAWCSKSIKDFLIKTSLTNQGWGDATDIELQFIDENGYLSELFSEEDLYINVPMLESGENITLDCIKLENMNMKVFEELIDEYGEFYCSI